MSPCAHIISFPVRKASDLLSKRNRDSKSDKEISTLKSRGELEGDGDRADTKRFSAAGGQRYRLIIVLPTIRMHESIRSKVDGFRTKELTTFDSVNNSHKQNRLGQGQRPANRSQSSKYPRRRIAAISVLAQARRRSGGRQPGSKYPHHPSAAEASQWRPSAWQHYPCRRSAPRSQSWLERGVEVEAVSLEHLTM